MKNDIQHLMHIGLSEKEAMVYIALSELGQATAYRIAVVSGLKQATVYVILEALREKGLLLKVPHIKKQLFIVKELTEYLDILSDSLENARRVNARLLQGRKKGQPTVTYYEGIEGVKESILYRFGEFESETLLHMYGPLDGDVKKEVMKEYLRWNDMSVEKGLAQHIIVSDGELAQFGEIQRYASDTFVMRTVKDMTLPHNLSLEINTKFVRIISTKPYEATIIEDEKVVTFFTQLFAQVWKQARGV